MAAVAFLDIEKLMLPIRFPMSFHQIRWGRCDFEKQYIYDAGKNLASSVAILNF